ncbi:hypothetical protein EDD85DRAFT_778460 [Armillaria nabsnona]|nr:hypothetical protein EDD85DRAFT_778460 [Armillaria nabsnona]
MIGLLWSLWLVFEDSPRRFPVDLLDRVLIVGTKPYDGEGMEQILQLRCQEDDVNIIADVTGVLTTTTTQTLRYSLNLISCAQILAWKRKVKQVGAEDP